MNDAIDTSMPSTTTWWRRLSWPVLLIAVLAYAPPLRASPGRMPSDTKLYLYLDPGRLLSDAAWMWDTRQFGGWVPHQSVGYLWPMGPWFWAGERAGLPDWVTHRLWLGTLVFAAAMGLRWCARLVGLSSSSATAAGLLYGLSPYILPYLARTSGQLPNWAGLGWVLGLVIVGARRAALHDPSSPRTRWLRWREPALLGLVVATMSGLNATAVILVAPVPLLWLLDVGLRGEASWRRLIGFTLRTGACCALSCLWWVVGLVVQGGYGADVLGFTETIDAVSFTSSGGEVLRGLGYWLTYVTDRTGPLTEAGVEYQVSLRAILVSFLPALLACGGLLLSGWRARRFAGWAMLTGVVIGVGVHPITAASPLFSAIAAEPGSGLALALRSSTRAVPCLLVGVALAAGALADGWSEAVRRRGRSIAPGVGVRLVRVSGAVLVGAVAVVNLPAWFRGEIVSSTQSRERSVPADWVEVGQVLDELPGSGRVLQLPGTEFGAHRWGTLVDPLLPAITKRPLITRDLVPSGSPGAMDLLYALDDRLHDGLLEPAAVAPVARLLGADYVLVPGDLPVERYGTRRPSLVDALLRGAPGLADPVRIGAPLPPEPPGEYDDGQLDAGGLAVRTALPAASIYPVVAPAALIRSAETEVLLAGSGAGVVDAAEVGLIDGHELIRYTAALDDEELSAAAAAAELVVITDSNRRQARQWRGSRDTLGATEPAGGSIVVGDDLADHRLGVFPTERFGDQTAAESPVTARASSYGDPITYRPEDRPANAVDGDPMTAWRVGDRGEVVGARVRLDPPDPLPDGASISVLQAGTVNMSLPRMITAVRVTTNHGTTDAELNAGSGTSPQVIVLPPGPAAWIEIEILATDTGRRDEYFDFGPVGLAEVTLPGVVTGPEVIVAPTRLPTGVADRTVLVLTRWRADPDDRRRRDPEPSLVRRVALAEALTLSMIGEVRLDQNASDESVAQLVGLPLPGASSRLRGALEFGPWAATDGLAETAWVTGGVDPTGASITVPLDAPLGAAPLTLVFSVGPEHSRPSEVSVTAGGVTRSYSVAPGSDRLAVVTDGLSGDELTVTITAIEPAMSVDSRTGEALIRPVALREIEGLEVLDRPAMVSVTCTDEIASIDGLPLALHGEAALADILGGGPMRVTPCDPAPFALASGSHRFAGLAGGAWQLDRLVAYPSGAPIGDSLVVADHPTAAPLAPVAPSAGTTASSRPGQGATVTGTVVGRTRRQATVSGCPLGCWVVLGEGWNPGWSAELDGDVLGSPEAVNGGFAGWWVPGGDDGRVVTIAWTPQRTMWIGLTISALGLLAALTIVIRTRRTSAGPAGALTDTANFAAPRWTFAADPPGWGWVASSAMLGAVAIAPRWGLITLGAALVARLLRRRVVLVAVGGMIAAAITAWYLVELRDRRPPAGYGWVINVEPTHRAALLAVVLCAAGVSSRRDLPTDPQRRATPGSARQRTRPTPM